MKKMRNLMMYAAAGALIFTACKKDDDDSSTSTADKKAPVVTIDSPTDNSSVDQGKAIHIQGKVLDETELKSCKVSVTGAATWDSTIAMTGKEASFHKMVPALLPGAYVISIEAEDKAGNKSAAETRNVTVKAGDIMKPGVNQLKVVTNGGILSSAFDNEVQIDAADETALGEIKVEVFNDHTSINKVISTKTISAVELAGKKSYSGKVIMRFALSDVSGLNNQARVIVTVKDLAGNEGTKTLSTKIDQ